MVNSGDKEHDAVTLVPNDYIVAKLMTKKAIRHYVGVIFKTTDEFADEFYVTFLKRSKKSVTAHCVTIPDVEDIVDVV